MWCRDCHKEVNAQPAGAAGIVCPLCRKPLFSTSRHSDAIQQAREILERWQSTDLFEKITTTAPLTSLKQQDRSPLRTISLGPRTTPTLELPIEQPSRFDAVPVEKYSTSAIAFTESALPRTTESLSADVPANDVPIVAVGAAESIAESERFDEQLSVPVVADVVRPRESSHGKGPQPNEQSEQSRSSVQAVRSSQTSTRTARVNSSPPPTPESLLEQLVAPVLATAAPPLEVISPRTAKRPSNAEQKLPEVQTDPDSFQPIEELKAATMSSSPLSSEGLTRMGRPELTSGETYSTESMSPIEQEFVPAVAASVQALEVHAETDLSSESLLASEFAQSNASETVPREEIRLVSAIHGAGSVESTNLVNQELDPATKKIPRTAIRRPPLHRRFQLDHPDPAPASGSTTVTRKLRLDLPGAPADNSDALPAAAASAAAANSGTTSARIVSNSPKPGPRLRIDAAETVDHVTETDGRRRRTLGLPKTRYIDEPHETALRGPHFEVHPPGRSNLTSLTGQFLAYLGVLGLTIGTAIVIYGHFGGYSQYTPTGWLVTTVAQMLLFLGVINLVSGGIEQNNEDVSRRINSIGEQLLRIEQVTSEVLKGPKISAHHYADPDSIPEEADVHEKVATHQG
jgi:hypothetical protein